MIPSFMVQRQGGVEPYGCINHPFLVPLGPFLQTHRGNLFFMGWDKGPPLFFPGGRSDEIKGEASQMGDSGP